VVCLVAGFMTLLDVSIVNVALPSIQSGLRESSDDLQWVLSGYALTFGLVLVPSGRLGDARAERGRAFGLLGATIGLSTAVGPLLGGAIIALAGTGSGWRWIFFVNLPIGLAALPLAFRLIPAGRPGPERGKREDLDPVGVLLLGAGVVLVLLPLVEAEQWHGNMKWLLFGPAAALFVALAGWERRYGRRHQPAIDLSLFRLRSYTFGTVIALLYFAGFTAIFFIFTIYLQDGLRFSALLAGLSITPFALGSAVAAAIGGRLVARLGRPLVTAGLALVAVGLVGASVADHLVPGRAAALATALPLLVAGIGSGFVISPNQTLTLAEVPPAEGGSAAAVLQTGQRIGSAVGIAVIGSVFFSTLTATHGGYARAFQDGLTITIALVAVALAAALFDAIAERRPHHRGGSDLDAR
jgi:MFS family permease